MTKTSVDRDVFNVTGEMETNQDTLRVLIEMGQAICSTWHAHDTVADNARMNEQLFVIFNTLETHIGQYNKLITEAAYFKRAAA